MRQSVLETIARSAAGNHELYPKGSIILCNACGLPIFKLEGSIAIGDKAGRTARLLKPLSLADLEDLATRPGVELRTQLLIKAWSLEQRRNHISLLREVRAGDPAVCPVCVEGFHQVHAVEKNEVLDRAYTLQLVTIPPAGHKSVAVRGRRNHWEI